MKYELVLTGKFKKGLKLAKKVRKDSLKFERKYYKVAEGWATITEDGETS